MTNKIKELFPLGQSIWYDNIQRGMFKSGQLQDLIDQGVVGVTSNPTIFERAIVGSQDYLREHYGLSEEAIITTVKSCLEV